jgi:hypothetical protein
MQLESCLHQLERASRKAERAARACINAGSERAKARHTRRLEQADRQADTLRRALLALLPVEA